VHTYADEDVHFLSVEAQHAASFGVITQRMVKYVLLISFLVHFPSMLTILGDTARRRYWRGSYGVFVLRLHLFRGELWVQQLWRMSDI
jgi:hypothetical protein